MGQHALRSVANRFDATVSGSGDAMETTACPTERAFTVNEYHRLADAGILRATDRVELMNGRIYAMPPIGTGHAECVRLLTDLMYARIASRARVSVQNPIRLDDRSEPEPDLALLDPAGDYLGCHPHPRDVLLLIEVSDTTLDFDLHEKTPLYARAGIREVWVVALGDERVHVFREPGRDGYAWHRVFRRGDTLQVGGFPDTGFAVEEVLGS